MPTDEGITRQKEDEMDIVSLTLASGPLAKQTKFQGAKSEMPLHRLHRHQKLAPLLVQCLTRADKLC